MQYESRNNGNKTSNPIDILVYLLLSWTTLYCSDVYIFDFEQPNVGSDNCNVTNLKNTACPAA